MNKIASFGLICLTLLLFSSAGQVSADIIAFDNFNYPDGSLVGNNGWIAHSPAAPLGDLLVANGQAVIQHGVPADDAHIEFGSIAGDIYYGIDFSVSATANISGTDTEYFAHFKDTGNNFSARFDVVAPTGAGNYSVGIASDESTADAIWGSDLMFDTTYRAVVRYDQVANIAQLWIDAASASDTSIMGEDRADPGDTVSQFALRQSDSTLNETVTVDGLVVGSTFNDVVTAAAIPEPTSCMVLMAFATGLFVRRRR